MTRTRGRAIMRGALAAVSIAVGVWLAVGLNSVRLQGEADGIGGSGKLSGGRFEEARDLYRRARDGNPGTGPEVQEARLLIVGGHGEEATELLLDVVEREPESSYAWGLLRVAAERIDPALARRADRQVNALRPEPDG